MNMVYVPSPGLTHSKVISVWSNIIFLFTEELKQVLQFRKNPPGTGVVWMGFYHIIRSKLLVFFYLPLYRSESDTRWGAHSESRHLRLYDMKAVPAKNTKRGASYDNRMIHISLKFLTNSKIQVVGKNASAYSDMWLCFNQASFRSRVIYNSYSSVKYRVYVGQVGAKGFYLILSYIWWMDGPLSVLCLSGPQIHKGISHLYL